MSERVAVVGAGLLGRVLAWKLLRSGWRVSLFDRDNKSGTQSCGMAGAGMLCVDAETVKTEPLIGQLGRDSVSLWRKLLDQLPLPVYFQSSGSLAVAHEGDREDFWTFEHHARERLPLGRMELVSGERLAQLEPTLATRFHKALFFPHEGQLEAWDLFPALERALLDGGASWHEQTEVSRTAPGLLEHGTESVRFDWVIDCRGLGAKPEWRGLRGVRGELICVQAPEVHLQRPIRLIHPRYPLYVVPRPDHTFLIGATSLESEDFSPLSVRSALELLSAAYSLDSAFAEGRILNTSVHCRPALPHNQPQIGYAKGLLRVNGLYRHGFLLAPAVADEVISLLQGEKPRHPEMIKALDEVTGV